MGFSSGYYGDSAPRITYKRVRYVPPGGGAAGRRRGRAKARQVAENDFTRHRAKLQAARNGHYRVGSAARSRWRWRYRREFARKYFDGRRVFHDWVDSAKAQRPLRWYEDKDFKFRAAHASGVPSVYVRRLQVTIAPYQPATVQLPASLGANGCFSFAMDSSAQIGRAHV